MQRRVIALFLFVCSLVPAYAYAQYTLHGIDSAVLITLSPNYPQPNSRVHLTVDSSYLDLTNAAITWAINGKVVAQGVGNDSIDILTGDLGSELDVTVQVSSDVGTASATARIVPTEMDLLMDSNSYVPPFYEGRALPAAGTTVVLQAMPTFVAPDGTRLKAADLSYTWKVDGRVLTDQSGQGRTAVTIPAPPLYSSNTVSVDAVSSDGLLGGSASMTVTAADPVIELYEDHPVYGMRYGNALGANASVSDAEMTFAAVPYFASAASPADPSLSYRWKINGVAVKTAAAAPDHLTLSSDPNNTTASVSLNITHATNYFLNAVGSWQLTLGDTSGHDAFHTGLQ